MSRALQPCLVFSLCVAIGCDTAEEAERLDVTVGGNIVSPTFSWDGPNVTRVSVGSCAGSCTGLLCVDGGLRSDPDCSSTDCSPGTAWSVDLYDSEKELSSPISYGMLGSEPDPSAQTLMVGVLHGVEVSRDGPCDPPEEGCGKTVAKGCALFTP